MEPTHGLTQKPTEHEALAVIELLQAEGHVSDALVQEKLAAVRENIRIGMHTRVEAAVQMEKERRELEPAQFEQLISQIKLNFMNDKEFPRLNPDVQWAQVEADLRARPEIMRVILMNVGRIGNGSIENVIVMRKERDGKFLFGYRL